MRLERSKEWWIARARAEGDAVIGAGVLARDPLPDDKPAVATAEENRIAFGPLHQSDAPPRRIFDRGVGGCRRS